MDIDLYFQVELYRQLIGVRSALREGTDLPVHVIAPNKNLLDMCRVRSV